MTRTPARAAAASRGSWSAPARATAAARTGSRPRCPSARRTARSPATAPASSAASCSPAGSRSPTARSLLLSRTTGTDAFAVVAMQRTDRDGVVRFPVSPTVKTAYRLKFEGTRLLRPSRSGVVRVGVRPSIADLGRADLDRPGRGHHRLGGGDLRGSAVRRRDRRPARPERQEEARQVHRARDRHHRRDRCRVVRRSRLPAPPCTGWSSGTREGTPPRAVSDTVRVRVGPSATSLSIRGRTMAERVTVSGVLRGGGGSTLPGRVVALEKLGEDGVTWTAIAFDTTNTRGQGGVPRSRRSEGNSYRLSLCRWAAASRRASAESSSTDLRPDIAEGAGAGRRPRPSCSRTRGHAPSGP